MIRFDEFLGLNGPLEMVTRLLDSGRIPHALLFHGPEGVGKASLAHSLAAALLCDSPNPQACGSCPSCLQLEAGTHPDYLFIERLQQKTDPNKLSAFIVIKQIRDLLGVVAMAPRQARRRIIVIDPADLMNRESQNALLKTLEEPPGASVLILVASRSHLLLPTVRSRSFSIAFGPMRVSELAISLEKRGMPANEAEARAALSEGRPGRALALELPELLQRREEILQCLESLTSSAGGIAELPLLARELSGKTEETTLEGMQLLEALLRDVARAGLQSGGETFVHADLSDRLQLLSRALEPARCAAIIKSLERLRSGLRFNLNRKLVAEALLAAIAGGPLPR